MMGGTSSGTGGTGHRAALAAALGSAVLDVLTDRGIVADPNMPGYPRAGGNAPVYQLEQRRNRWVTTSATYLGAAAADPVTVLGRIVGGPRRPGEQTDPGSLLRDGGHGDPAPKQPFHRPVPGASDYPQGDGSRDDDGRADDGG
jgi:hypothetical protein